MIQIINNVLNPEQIALLMHTISQGEFQCGKQTAGWHAQGVKNNQQWHGGEQVNEQLQQALLLYLTQHPQFSAITYAKKMMPFIISCSADNGGYGNHIDDALMHGEQMVRTDISCTIFISEPEDYEGGELVMSLGGAELPYKLRAGDAIIYPSTTLHKVNPVTQGQRLVALTWIESFIADSQQREMLYDLDCARKAIMQQNGKSHEFDLITKTHANLLRRWSAT
ncbi:Fe2+-dependent dioxygenase [Shewanella halifaxensis]|uniref:Fe2+-dependent dioxygenase n=1 Tax=Shewanella halifaxensis TaxID=271098 RepID=UPI0013A628EA|nr:Fe2+-dependent dioxygenase [Shewanella halifaxensis]